MRSSPAATAGRNTLVASVPAGFTPCQVPVRLELRRNASNTVGFSIALALKCIVTGSRVTCRGSSTSRESDERV